MVFDEIALVLCQNAIPAARSRGELWWHIGWRLMCTFFLWCVTRNVTCGIQPSLPNPRLPLCFAHLPQRHWPCLHGRTLVGRVRVRQMSGWLRLYETRFLSAEVAAAEKRRSLCHRAQVLKKTFPFQRNGLQTAQISFEGRRNTNGNKDGPLALNPSLPRGLGWVNLVKLT